MQQQANIRVNCAKVGTDRINPFLFGHFVEDIRDHMDAMLAYPLKDMDFESNPKSDGVSGQWYPYTNGRSTLYAVEPAAPKHSGHSQMIRVFSEDEGFAGIAQNIAVKGGVSYGLTLFARASIEIRHLIAEIVDLQSQEIISRCSVPLSGHDWKEYKASLAVARPCAKAELRVYVPAEHERWRDSVATGIIWLDHLSILPDDSVGNVKKEVVDMARGLNAGMMRLAGNYISAYHWRNGIGPLYERPNMINEAWGGWTAKYFGTDEFVRFCRELDVEPMICVNAGSGTPEEAAEWVEYCNGGPDTPMGALRAANGHPEPYGVKYWEIGNEMFGPWQVGHCTAEQFAHRYVRFAKAMKAADDGIVLLACGDTRSEWNASMLEIAGEYMDYLTIHMYHGYRRLGMNENTPREERFYAMVTYAERTREVISRAAELIRSREKHSHVKLAFTEYNTMYYPNNNRKGLPMEHTLEAAAVNAANLNEFIRNCGIVEIGSFSDLVNGWLGGCIRVGDYYADQFRGKVQGWSGKALTVYGTPTYYVLQLYANRDIAHVVHSEVECGDFSVNKSFGTMQLNHLPKLDVVACVNEKGTKATVFVVNRSLETISAAISLPGAKSGGKALVHEIAADDIDSINSVFETEKIKPAAYDLHAEDGCWNWELRASAVYVLEFDL